MLVINSELWHREWDSAVQAVQMGLIKEATPEMFTSIRADSPLLPSEPPKSNAQYTTNAFVDSPVKRIEGTFYTDFLSSFTPANIAEQTKKAIINLSPFPPKDSVQDIFKGVSTVGSAVYTSGSEVIGGALDFAGNALKNVKDGVSAVVNTGTELIKDISGEPKDSENESNFKTYLPYALLGAAALIVTVALIKRK